MSGGNFHRFFVNALTFSRVPLIFAFMGAAIAAECAESVAWTVAACALMFFAVILAQLPALRGKNKLQSRQNGDTI